MSDTNHSADAAHADDAIQALSQRFGRPAEQNDLDARHWRASVANTLFGRPPEPVRVGRFTVLTRMGSGGSGSVFSAWDPKLERRVALKLLHAGHDAAAVEREAKLLARLNHPHVVAVYDVGEHEGTAFLAMEFIEGATLDTWLEKTGPTHAKILALFEQVAAGLEAAHTVGVVHGDIKPANILVGSDDRARLGDFGIGRLADEAGLRGGTPAYMAPEQMAGGPAEFASDQFSLCLTLFQCLSSQRPFSETTAEARAAAIEQGPPPLPSGVPRWLETSLRRGLSRDPKARHPDIATLRASWKHGQRRSQRRVVGGSLAAAVLVGAGLATVGLDTDAQPNTCESMATRVREAWSPDTRAALEATFERQPTAYAPVAWARVSDALDEHIDALGTFVGQACEGADAERRLRQQLCAQRRLTEFEALLDVLSTGEAEVVERSVAALSTLTPPSACSGAAPLPSSVQDLDEREALHRTIARARALRGVGKTDAAVAQLQASLEGARDLADPRLTALVQLELGEHIAETEGVVDGGAALPTLESAYNAALAAEDRHLAATVLLALASANFRSARFSAAVRWLQRLEQANRSLDDARLSGRAAILLALLAAVRDGDEDPTRITEALAQLRRTGARDTWLAAGLNNLGEMEFNAGNYAAARRHYEHALQIWIEVLGPAHPNVAGGRGNLGEVEMFDGDLSAARAQFELAAKVRASAWGEQSRWTIHTHAHLGDIERMAGNTEAAAAYYQGVLDFTSHSRPLQGRENFFEVDSGDRQLEPWARNGLALLALERGDGQRAFQLTEPLPKGVEIRPGRHPDLAARVDVRALALLAIGRPAQALSWLDQEGPAAQAAYPGHFKAAYVPLARARILLELGRAPEACGHVAQAQTIVRGDPGTPAETRATAKELAATCQAVP